MVVTGLLTGYNTPRHLHLIGLTNSPLCRRCGAEEETSVHILHECEALPSWEGGIWNSTNGTGVP